jgi:hypothetical protein
MNLKRIIREEIEDFEWIESISGEWEPKVGDQFICKPGFSRDYMSNNYGGAAYIEGRIYTIESIEEGTYDLILFTVENGNGVFKKAAEPYF